MRNHQEQNDLPPALRALADPTRLKIMLMLEGRERTVGEIVDFFDLSQPTISRHLQTLTAAGLVRRTKKAQRVFYGINSERVKATCITLAACFPCCCMEVKTGLQISPSTESKKTENKKTEDKKPAADRKPSRRKPDHPNPGRKRR
jgi:DNA-binding transcriptional ArsR family regulator